MQGGKQPPTWVIFFSEGHNVDSLHVILLETTKLLLMGQEREDRAQALAEDDEWWDAFEQTRQLQREASLEPH